LTPPRVAIIVFDYLPFKETSRDIRVAAKNRAASGSCRDERGNTRAIASPLAHVSAPLLSQSVIVQANRGAGLVGGQI